MKKPASKPTVFILASLFSLAFAVSASAGAMQKLVKYEIKNGSSIEKSLTGKPGDPKRGRAIVINRKKGNCLTCHEMPIPDQSFHGNIAPNLAGVAERYSAGELRLRLVDATKINADTIMPPFYRNEGLHRVMKKFQGKTILSAQEVEDVIAYLLTLK